MSLYTVTAKKHQHPMGDACCHLIEEVELVLDISGDRGSVSPMAWSNHLVGQAYAMAVARLVPRPYESIMLTSIKLV